MTLILAVEPDPRQASRLSSVLRGRRHTEVVVAKSADAAIEMIGGRVPDVLLTAPLLSPQDEARLAEWLKDLGPAATHVQALTIPILAPKTVVEPPRGGLLSGLRRRTQQGPEGCEPKMFAEHVATYLEQAIVERMDDVTPWREVPPELREVPRELPMAGPIVSEPPPAPAQSEWVAGEIEEYVHDVEEHVQEVEPLEAQVHEVEALDAHEPVPDTAITEVTVAVPSAAEEDEGLWLLTRSPQVIEFTDEPASAEDDTLPLVMVPPSAAPRMALPPEVHPIVPFEVVFEPPEVITVRDDLDTRALRRLAAPEAPQRADSVETAPDTSTSVQDEWGFFDPSKCGFSALLEKLDEITDEDKQAESSVRIVTHY